MMYLLKNNDNVIEKGVMKLWLSCYCKRKKVGRKKYNMLEKGKVCL